MERKVKYDYALKLECVKLVIEKGYSSEAVSNKKSISESNLRRWVSFYREYIQSDCYRGRIGFIPIDFKQKVLLSIDKDLYLSPIIDLFNGEIISYDVS